MNVEIFVILYFLLVYTEIAGMSIKIVKPIVVIHFIYLIYCWNILLFE
jgi:hypothetical protein